MVVEVAVALCCWCWCSCVGAREKICVRDAFGAQRERRVVSARIIEREKRKGDVVDFYTGILCSQSGAKKSGRRFDCTQRKGGGRRTVNASRRVVVESALRASLRSARAIILLLLLLLSAVFQKHTLLKSRPFFSSLLRESKVPCSVFVCGRFRRRRKNCSCCLFCFAVKVVFKVPFVGKNAIHNGGDDSDGVIQKEKKTMTSYDLRQSRLVSLSKGLSLSTVVSFFRSQQGKIKLSPSRRKKTKKKAPPRVHIIIVLGILSRIHIQKKIERERPPPLPPRDDDTKKAYRALLSKERKRKREKQRRG